MDSVVGVLHDLGVCNTYNLHDESGPLYLPPKITLRIIRETKRGTPNRQTDDD